MRMILHKRLLLCIGVVAVQPYLAGAQTSTHPKDFVTVQERPPRGAAQPLPEGRTEVDDRSILRIEFDENRMAQRPQGGSTRVLLAVAADLIKSTAKTPVVPIPHYVSATAPSASGGSTQPSVVVHLKDYLNPGDIVPDTQLDLLAIGFSDYDYMELRIQNLVTLESAVYTMMPQPFGFRVKVADSLLFLKRFGMSDEDKKNGVDEVNFGPAPGVTYGGSYLPRGSGFLRFLRPGGGMNVSFMNWTDPAFDLSTGKFAPGTKGSDVQVGLGVQFSLLNNILQFTYGANLHVEQGRQYWGIGISFVNLTTRIAGLIQ